MNNVLNIRHLLLKVSEVKLFGEEELTVDLYISFCEWPSDHTKVLIFGHRYESNQVCLQLLYIFFFKSRLLKVPLFTKLNLFIYMYMSLVFAQKWTLYTCTYIYNILNVRKLVNISMYDFYCRCNFFFYFQSPQPNPRWMFIMLYDNNISPSSTAM